MTSRPSPGPLPFLCALALAACTTEVHHHHTDNVYNVGDTDEDVDTDVAETDDTVETDDSDVDTDPDYVSHLPPCDTVVSLPELAIDLWGVDGHLFYFEITPEQRRAGDAQACRGGGLGGPPYDLEDEDTDVDDTCPNYATNVRVVPAGSTTCADTQKVEVELVGQSSFRPWLEIPNIKLVTDEFIDQKFASKDKNIRFNNGQADSTIVREAVALRVFRAMGHEASPSRFAKTRSNVWDTEVREGAWAAHNMVRPYKKAYFEAEFPEAVHVWEGAGDPFGEGWYDVECEWTAEDECDDDALDAIVRRVADAPKGDGFMEATADVVDWPAIHRNQCLSALTGTGDDWIHNNNNVVLVLREDGRVQFLPYSTDISGGHPWYPVTSYDGIAYLTRRCAEDEACRLEGLTTCQAMVDDFEALDVPTTIVDERCDALEAAGLTRAADVGVCEQMRAFYEDRPGELRDELQRLIDGIGDTGFDTGGIIPL